MPPFRLVLAALCLTLVGCVGAPPVAPNPAEGPVAVDLQTYRIRRRTVQVTVNGVQGKFLLDTAGGLSQLSPTFAAKVGCKPWGRFVGHHMIGDKIETQRCDGLRVDVAGVSLDAPVMGVLDLMASLPKDAEPLDGLLALDLFAGRKLTLDLGHHRMWIETPASFRDRIRDMREGRARLSRELQGAALAVNVAADTPNGPLWFELDSGNGGTLLVSKPYAELFGLDPKQEGPQHVRFTLSGGATVEGLAFTPDMLLDGNIGMPFLALQVVALDLEAGRVWFKPSGAPPPPPLIP